MPFAFFSKIRIIKFETVKSTNDLALERLKNDEAQNGDIVLSEFQSIGKGQLINSWFSSPGSNLLASFICKNIQLKVTELSKLNMLVSMAVHKVLFNYFGSRTTIKWPNDIYVDEHKIAGILMETILQGEYIKHVVIGIGLNVNEEKFPNELLNACSIFTLSNQLNNVESVLHMMIEQLDLQLSKLGKLSFKDIKEPYELVLLGMDSKRYFRIANNQFEGIISGVNEHGQLCVEIDNEIKTFNHKEITFDFSMH